jgi:hypothetical protein
MCQSHLFESVCTPPVRHHCGTMMGISSTPFTPAHTFPPHVLRTLPSFPLAVSRLYSPHSTAANVATSALGPLISIVALVVPALSPPHTPPIPPPSPPPRAGKYTVLLSRHSHVDLKVAASPTDVTKPYIDCAELLDNNNDDDDDSTRPSEHGCLRLKPDGTMTVSGSFREVE